MNPQEKPRPAISDTRQSLGAEAPAGRLKLINTGSSSDGRHVHVHFITDENRVTTIQLETRVAADFHARLGDVLTQIQTGRSGLTHVN